MKILITSATGYVGGQLLPKLVQRGHELTCMVRDASRFRPNIGGVHIVEADVLHPGTLPPGLQGIEVAYYLIHSMGGGPEGFAERDRRAARNFAVAAKQAGVQRIIYLGGLTSQNSPVSLHLKSRQETGAVLREFGPPVTEFRAGIIVGNGSLSFEIIRCLTERLPVMICPRWVMTRTPAHRHQRCARLPGCGPRRTCGGGRDRRNRRRQHRNLPQHDADLRPHPGIKAMAVAGARADSAPVFLLAQSGDAVSRFAHAPSD